MEGLRHNAGNIIAVFHQVAVLGEGGTGAGDVHLLKDVPAQQMAGHLAGDGHHGDGIHIGGGDAGNQVGGSRAGGDHAHAHLAGHPVVARRHMAGILFRAHQGIADLRRRGQRVYRGADGRPRVAEDMLHACPFQALNQCLRTSHFTAPP